ncbi:PAN2-PAN3 deadenylation complex subunit Pan3 [Exaiptasia diaphana]|uniref:PAN2-PAN3 deadenylation complex subunit PAN3 n=1 Tax=Exaiptasia diaphana TaxID=2652724 RepID=A0A913XWF5_EXADI|nr:PAN2-PAN3 deadenylation complex subunit Pan3 [Exaiptasia diaphana]KXJ28409.1 PAB-dependent poly(A)-specific ribonuclease subunit PAN3 [Exaiptasia diaphana]
MNPSGPGGGFRPVKPTLCRYFSANGYCFYGDQCQFLHAKSANENRQGNAPFHRSSSTPVFPSSNGPIGAQGHRVYKGNNAMNQQAQENMIHNFSGLSFSAKGQVPQSNAMAQMHNSHVSPLSPTKKSFSSSLAPGGPISPLHSPKPNQPKLKSMQLQPSSSSYEFLPNTTNQHQQQQQQQQPFNPESIDGTMYFYPQQNHNQPSVVLPSYHAVVSEPAHLAHLQNNQTRNNAFSMSAQLRQELMNQHALSMAQLDSDDPSVPKEVDSYHSLCPLEPLDTPPDQGQRTFGYTTTCYKAVNSKDGLLYVLRRVNGYRLVNAKSMVVVDQWKKITHSNIVNLREVFTTKAFSDSSLVFVYDYHPGAETLLSRHFSGPDSTLPLNPDGSLAFPRPGMPGPSGRSRHGGLMPEKLIWSYIIQLSSALRVIHSAGLACRMIDPSKILLIGNSRLRINGCGIFDILSFDPGNSPNAIAPHFQQEDLTSLGKLVLALASCYSLQSIQREHIQQALEYVAMNYSADLKNLIIYLLGSPPPTLMKSVNDIMPMIGARFYTQLEAAQVKCDVLEGELAKEMENGRILRILSKLGTINERPELGMDHNWSETGDRYLLKLFRDYLFHSVTDNGSPTVDLSHIVTCLNKLDSGTTEKVCLMSRDEQSVLVVSYRDLRNCFEGAFNEILAASLS